MSKNKGHIPMRKCIGCNTSFEKSTLNRITIKEDEILVDEANKAIGRGVYLCKNRECLSKAFKKKSFERSFKRNISQEMKESFEDRYYKK